MLKPIIACVSISGLAFLFIGLQTGLFGNRPPDDDEEEGQVVSVESRPAGSSKKKKDEPPPRAKFPDDLQPAARAMPVEKAAAYASGERVHKMVFMRANGALHPWHQTHSEYHEDWCAENVEETELIVVIGVPHKTFVDRTAFFQGPPVERFRWELEMSVVAAHTGRVLANRLFLNVPREIRKVEDFGLTSIGQPVHYRNVFNWVSNNSKVGFVSPVAGPIISVVGD
jgi:hypothetical protein